jgi:hypothetical protein
MKWRDKRFDTRTKTKFTVRKNGSGIPVLAEVWVDAIAQLVVAEIMASRKVLQDNQSVAVCYGIALDG